MTAATRSYPAPDPTPHVSALTWLSVFIRTLAIQGSCNYETLLGNGVGFALEPVLRQLPGGVHTDASKAAVTRESAYFNAHPYLASVAVGALARGRLTTGGLKVLVNNELQNKSGANPSDRSTRHIEVQLPANLTYRAGDHLSVVPRNDPALADSVARRFGW